MDFGIQIQGDVDNHGAPPEPVRVIVLTCVVFYNILRSQYNGHSNGQQPEDDKLLGDSQLVSGDDGHARNPAREAKHQRNFLRDYYDEGALAWVIEHKKFFSELP